MAKGDILNKYKPTLKIGESYSTGEKTPEAYIEGIGDVTWIPGLSHKPQAYRDELVNTVFGKLKEFRLGLYLLGVDIGYNRVQWLTSMDLISARLRNNVADKHLNLIQTSYINKFVLNSKGELNAVRVFEQGTSDSYIQEKSSISINTQDLKLESMIKNAWQAAEVDKKEWAIDDVFELPDEIYDMINLINRGWQFFEASTKEWKRFNKYRQQAYVWLARNYVMESDWNEEAKLSFLIEERERCLTNSLYLANKYLWYKDSDDRFKGEKQFKAWKAQEVVLFLIDLGLSLIIGKLRQIGFTTTIGGIMALRTMLSKNFYCKMVAQKGDKSEEIFEHKVKYAISKCEAYMKPSIPNWSGNKVKFGYADSKGGEESSASLFDVCAPAPDAINAGTPSITLLDEIGFMDNFGAIISQGRPTMFKWDSFKDRMVMTKQVIAWGTGGKTGGAGSAMEVEWKAAKAAFAERNFRHGLIPIFLNFYAKPGHNDKFYLAEKAFYYSKKKQVGEEDPKIVFHQSFPITEDDMFLQSSDTVISIASINLHIERIHRKISEEKLVSVRGYFEPIYDTDRKRGDEAYVPFYIIGARWNPADESMIAEDSPFACVTIYEKPDLTYENLYYKGSDPIFTSSGHSKFASTIKRADNKRTVAKLNYKSEDYRYEYLQSLLLNLYYSREYAGRKLGIKELLEFNVGGEYYNFCRELGYGGIMVGNKMLPESLQTSTIDIGINKRGTNSVMIVNRLEEMLIDNADKIDSIEFWTQLKTFVRKTTATGFKYEPENKKIHYDDEIDAETYAYINLLIHHRLPIRKLEDGQRIYQQNQKKKYYYDENYNLKLGTYLQANKANQHRRVA